jgi:hypothetical protein
MYYISNMMGAELGIEGREGDKGAFAERPYSFLFPFLSV